MDIGEKIRIAREGAGLTLEELGKLCGTTKQTIYKYENGIVTNIPLDRIEQIASATGVTAASILGWEEMPSSDDKELQAVLEELKNRDELRMLFKTAKGATKEDVLQAVKIIEALRK